MSQIAIRAALETALSALSPPLETQWENVSFKIPDAKTPYQKVDWLFADPENPAQADSMYRQRGIMQVMLRYPLNQGSAVAMARAEQIRGAFQRGNSYQKDGITIQIDRTAAILPAIIDGDRYCVPVRVRFFANVFT